MVAAAGDISTLNIQHGYVEGVVRGFRSGFLTTTTSRNVKLNLQETDYDQFLADEASTTNTVVEDFNFLRAQAMEPLGQFLDFITYMYTINNVILLLKDTLRRERAHSFTD
ncbi:hypothetical protein PF010_g20594 [Phytophthora fragariae]|uniref:Uncharacterized protein n=1 Tax=Phytophthora fragariae TaxID=53985 RepID=A0A6A3J665_9STRA|nr:hypothetical protein PF003_g27648 [Phytophthora fragariae]KAE8986963.1 hypothetical protein PF011_g19776 [Phytophthora fragariae]KAE9085091.1 hypothetical protein PF010_g20594 [Phytophthora fragariae]KAE9112212.1 hypothetical protein PF006_g20033 [Phytophthora fragariae]KAE9196858.1 hypothetical protein PF004_g20021 [Phytophthora fragariae]